jgi:hypothetical protein
LLNILTVFVSSSLISCISVPVKRESVPSFEKIDLKKLSSAEVLIEDKMVNIPVHTFKNEDFNRIFNLTDHHEKDAIEIHLFFKKCTYEESEKQDGIGQRLISIITLSLYPVDLKYRCNLVADIRSDTQTETLETSAEEIDKWGILSLFANGYGAASAVTSKYLALMKEDLVKNVISKSSLLKKD